MRIIVPVVIAIIIIAGVFAFLKFGAGSKNPVTGPTTQTTTSANVAKQAPVTGNPDDISSTINQAAQYEGNTVTADDESTVVNQNNSAAGAIGDSFNENSF